MDITPVFMSFSQETGHGIDLVHRKVGAADDCGTQEKAEDFFSSVISHEYVCDLFRRERAAPHVRFRAKRAVLAVVCTGIGKKGFEEDRVSTLWQRNRI